MASASARASHMRRNSSLQDVRAFVKHFPEHLSWRAQRESFAHEAMQYALWIPFAIGAYAMHLRTLSYLFATWFVLGEMMLVYTHEAHRKVLRGLRWWHIAIGIGAGVLYRGAPLVGTFGRFVVDYVFWGVIAMACAFPLVPKTFRADVPDLVYMLGFLRKPTEGRKSA
jgi:hypothetical protein